MQFLIGFFFQLQIFFTYKFGLSKTWIWILALIKNAGSEYGSALKPMQTYNTGCIEPPYSPGIRYRTSKIWTVQQATVSFIGKRLGGFLFDFNLIFFAQVTTFAFIVTATHQLSCFCRCRSLKLPSCRVVRAKERSWRNMSVI